MTLDCTGQRCPLPVIALARMAKDAASGTLITITTDDPAAAIDIPAWCRMRGHGCVVQELDGARLTHVVTVR